MSTNNLNDPNVKGNVTAREATDAEVARRNAYVKGRNDENNVQRQVRGYERASAQAQANDSAASGLLVGLLIALLAGGVGAILYFAGSDRTAPVSIPDTDINVTEVEVPEVEAPDVDIEAPDVEVPDVEVPDVNVEAPEAPEAE